MALGVVLRYISKQSKKLCKKENINCNESTLLLSLQSFMRNNFLNAVNFAEWQQIATLLLEEVNQGYLYTKLIAGTCKLFCSIVIKPFC